MNELFSAVQKNEVHSVGKTRERDFHIIKRGKTDNGAIFLG